MFAQIHSDAFHDRNIKQCYAVLNIFFFFLKLRLQRCLRFWCLNQSLRCWHKYEVEGWHSSVDYRLSLLSFDFGAKRGRSGWKWSSNWLKICGIISIKCRKLSHFNNSWPSFLSLQVPHGPRLSDPQRFDDHPLLPWPGLWNTLLGGERCTKWNWKGINNKSIVLSLIYIIVQLDQRRRRDLD